MAVKNKYPLEVQSVGEDTYIVMSRGHHDFGEFMQAAVDVYDGWALGGPRHVWCKTTPVPNGCRYNFVKEGTRGAWPATYCWEYGEEWQRWNGVPKEQSHD